MPTAYLLFGHPGSGKTTLAKRLERELRAVRFTPDEWMARLFGEDPPADTFADRAAAIQQMMQPLWRQCLVAGADVVLDYGFWRRSERDAARAIAQHVGATAALVALACPEAEARRRTMRRNAEPGRTLFIAPATFDALSARVEPLDADEAFIAPPA